MLVQGSGEQGKGVQAGGGAGGLREPMAREELDEELGGGEQVPDLAGRALRYVEELLGAGRQQHEVTTYP